MGGTCPLAFGRDLKRWLDAVEVIGAVAFVAEQQVAAAATTEAEVVICVLWVERGGSRTDSPA